MLVLVLLARVLTVAIWCQNVRQRLGDGWWVVMMVWVARAVGGAVETSRYDYRMMGMKSRRCGRALPLSMFLPIMKRAALPSSPAIPGVGHEWPSPPTQVPPERLRWEPSPSAARLPWRYNKALVKRNKREKHTI